MKKLLKGIMNMKVNDVVQFNENHKWCGCFGYIYEIKQTFNDDIKYMVGVPIPEKGTAYIFVLESENAIERIGDAILILDSEIS